MRSTKDFPQEVVRGWKLFQLFEREFARRDFFNREFDLIEFLVGEAGGGEDTGIAPMGAVGVVVFTAIFERSFPDDPVVVRVDATGFITIVGIATDLVVGMVLELEQDTGWVSDPVQVGAIVTHLSMPD